MQYPERISLKNRKPQQPPDPFRPPMTKPTTHSGMPVRILSSSALRLHINNERIHQIHHCPLCFVDRNAAFPPHPQHRSATATSPLARCATRPPRILSRSPPSDQPNNLRHDPEYSIHMPENVTPQSFFHSRRQKGGIYPGVAQVHTPLSHAESN